MAGRLLSSFTFLLGKKFHQIVEKLSRGKFLMFFLYCAAKAIFVTQSGVLIRFVGI
jgi:hypothetical protein